jgi:hypothetical protein
LKFHHLSAIEDVIYSWADRENILLVRAKADEKKVVLYMQVQQSLQESSAQS